MTEILSLIEAHSFFVLLLYVIILDVGWGVLRAIKEHKFNSCVGIDGGIRKVGMVFSIIILMLVDGMTDMNLLFMIPEVYLQKIGISKLGICEAFCLLYIACEALSVLKNMKLCGVPVPKKIDDFLEKFLSDMTDELPQK